MPRFETEWTGATRFVLALTVIVAAIAIAVGIRDYVQQKKIEPQASVSTPTAFDSNTKTLRKTSSAKTRQARMTATKANAPATVQVGDDNGEKAPISEVFPAARAKAIGPADNAPNTVRGQSAHDALEAAMDRAAMDRNNRRSKQFESITSCVPLPNGTKPEDADAAYYQNWAREYSCVF